ncbi:hypothetical protein HDU67_010397 [Dinochytrium kinnereticum]|nr:hypothetical protein HDU67_010397 [Dinochytrium kinnereticum]
MSPNTPVTTSSDSLNVPSQTGSAASSTPSTPSMKKNNAPRCGKEGCADRAVRTIGDCRHCQKKFCGKHRLPEAHICPNLQSCREEAMAKNASKLLNEKCVASKV